MGFLTSIAKVLEKITNWEGMAELVNAFGDHPALATVAISIPFVAFVLIVTMICWMMVCRTILKGRIDIELAKATGVNPRRKRWWQFWK
jgi:hypothetical protein